MTNVRSSALDASSRGLSVALWGGLPEKLVKDPSSGLFFFDDFENTPVLSADTNAIAKYDVYIDTNDTIKQGASLDFSEGEIGILEIKTAATDNNGPVIQAGGGAGNMCVISSTAGKIADIYFECRFKRSSVANASFSQFIGLAEEALCKDNGVLIDGDDMADVDHLGFMVKHADGDALLFHYVKSGQTDATISLDDSALTADTWVKAGFRIQRNKLATEQIALFIDGSEQSTYGTDDTLSSDAFPLDEEMTLTGAMKNGAAAAATLSMDWWALGVVLGVG